MVQLIFPLGNFARETSSVLTLGDSDIVHYDDLSPQVQSSIEDTFRRLQYFIDFARPGFYLRTEVPELKEPEEARPILDRVLIVFKLFKDAPVLSSIGFTVTETLAKPLHWRHYFHWRRVEPPLYVLAKGEESQFAEFWQEFHEIDPGNFGVYRFHLADFRPYLRDRFVDYVESLEYLLAPDSGEGRIASKFRSRGLELLGQHMLRKDRKYLYEELRDAYKLRSAIVHGDPDEESRLLPQGSSWEEKIGIVRRYDREAIKLFFRHGCLYDRTRRLDFLKRKMRKRHNLS